MFDRKQSLPWLVVLSIITGTLGQMLVLSAAPHPQPVRRVPRVIVRSLALSLKPHLPVHVVFPIKG